VVSIAGSFARTYRVRFDEAGADGFLRPSGYLRFAQDVAWQHSEAAGYDRAWYAARRSHWLVRSVALRLLRPVTYGTRLDVSTEVVGWRRVLARRSTRFVDEVGDLCAEADTDWALLGPTGRPMSVPKAIVDEFAPGASFAPLRVVLGEPPAEAATSVVQVRDTDIDPMGHLNNAVYLDLVDAAMTSATLVVRPLQRAFELEYLRPASAGAVLSIATWPTDPRLTACLIRAAGVELCRATMDVRGAPGDPGLGEQSARYAVAETGSPIDSGAISSAVR
jgi:acyl-CoA thioesterase FadM